MIFLGRISYPFLSAIKDTVCFKFGGVGVWGVTVYDLVYFECYFDLVLF